MKKYLPYGLLLVLLLVLMGWYMLTPNQSTLDDAEGAFRIKDKARIAKVVLHDDQKRTITLQKKNGVWMVNEKFEAREDLVERLLDIATRLESQAPVSKAAHENVLREMLVSNIQAQFYYEGKFTPEKVYYVGGPTLDSKGTYMLMEIEGKPAARPHIVRIPGFSGYLTPAYEVEADVWRNRKVFDVNPEAIKSIKVAYPTQDYQSFSIVAADIDSFVLYNSKSEVEPIQQGYLYVYASMFQNIQIEAFENSNEEREFITRETPFATIAIEQKNGKTTSAKFYLMPVNRRSKKTFDEAGNEVRVDIDKLYISFNNDADFGVAQMYVFGKLLRRFEDFTMVEKTGGKP